MKIIYYSEESPVLGRYTLLFAIRYYKKSPGGDNSRYIDGKVPTREMFFDPVLEKVLEKDIPVLENECTTSLFLTTRRAFCFGIKLTCSGKLWAFKTPVLEFLLKF